MHLYPRLSSDKNFHIFQETENTPHCVTSSSSSSIKAQFLHKRPWHIHDISVVTRPQHLSFFVFILLHYIITPTLRILSCIPNSFRSLCLIAW